MDGWVRVLRPLNSISVISRRWKGEHERLCAMKRRLDSGRISPPAGFEPATPWSEVGSANRSATRTLRFWKEDVWRVWTMGNGWRTPAYPISSAMSLRLWWAKHEGAIKSTKFSLLQVYGTNFHRSRASNSKAIHPIWPKIKLVQDFIPFLVTKKTEKEPRCYRINIFSITSLWKTFLTLNGNSTANNLI